MSDEGTPRTIGVLITYYNEREMLRECLESLLTQPKPPDEILVYDDASSNPAEDFLPLDFPGRVIRGDTNRGPGHGRNVLLHESQSEYVHFHDADDLFHPDWCQEVRSAIDRTAADIVLTEITSVRDGRRVSEHVLGLSTLRTEPDLVSFGLRGSILVPATTFRRVLGERLGGFRTREVLPQSEDFDFHIRLAAGSRYTVVARPLVTQRLRDGSHSSSADGQRLCWTSAVTALDLLATELPVRYRDEIADAYVRVGTQLLGAGARDEARVAYRKATSIGRPRYVRRPWTYRIVAQVLGPEAATWLSRARRRLALALGALRGVNRGRL
jgi:glycosyltransferase involved in cell wall biosynthesis